MRPASEPRPLVEWVVGIASALVVAALAGDLIHRAMFEEPAPARLEVTLERVEPTGQGPVLRIVLTNLGDTAAAAVVVSATPPDPALRRQITFDHIAPRSTRRGTLILAAPHPSGEVILAIDGYPEP